MLAMQSHITTKFWLSKTEVALLKSSDTSCPCLENGCHHCTFGQTETLTIKDNKKRKHKKNTLPQPIVEPLNSKKRTFWLRFSELVPNKLEQRLAKWELWVLSWQPSGLGQTHTNHLSNYSANSHVRLPECNISIKYLVLNLLVPAFLWYICNKLPDFSPQTWELQNPLALKLKTKILSVL